MAQNINGAVNTPESILASELINEFGDLQAIISEESLRRLCNSLVYALSSAKAPFNLVEDYARGCMESLEESIYLLNARLGDKSQ